MIIIMSKVYIIRNFIRFICWTGTDSPRPLLSRDMLVEQNEESLLQPSTPLSS